MQIEIVYLCVSQQRACELPSINIPNLNSIR